MSTIGEEKIQAFIEATRKTLSEMAFLDALPCDAADTEPVCSQVFYLSFLEPEQGFAALYLPLECKKTIVENIYGEDWQQLHSDQIDDCLLEILNVLVGNYLSDVYGENVKRDMGLPQLLFDDAGIADRGIQADIFLDAEGVTFKAVLSHG